MGGDLRVGILNTLHPRVHIGRPVRVGFGLHPLPLCRGRRVHRLLAPVLVRVRGCGGLQQRVHLVELLRAPSLEDAVLNDLASTVQDLHHSAHELRAVHRFRRSLVKGRAVVHSGILHAAHCQIPILLAPVPKLLLERLGVYELCCDLLLRFFGGVGLLLLCQRRSLRNRLRFSRVVTAAKPCRRKHQRQTHEAEGGEAQHIVKAVAGR
mmetsp:Transcript_66014/g.153377  ORF Transcript_66014/g.153377 Transcript_66014/m.153377 type:complete len:209 (+) Transcript_66014:291-917(+)